MADEGPDIVFGGSLEEMLHALGLTALVLARQDIELAAKTEAEAEKAAEATQEHLQ